MSREETDILSNASLGPFFTAIGSLINAALALAVRVGPFVQPAVEALVLTILVVLIFRGLDKLMISPTLISFIRIGFLLLGMAIATMVEPGDTEPVRTVLRGVHYRRFFSFFHALINDLLDRVNHHDTPARRSLL